MTSTIGTCCLCNSVITHDFNASEPQMVGSKPGVVPLNAIKSVRQSLLDQQAGGTDENLYLVADSGPAATQNFSTPEAQIDHQTLSKNAFAMPLGPLQFNDNRTRCVLDVAELTANNYQEKMGNKANPNITNALHSIANATNKPPDYSRMIVTPLNQGGLEQFNERIIKKDNIAINSTGENIVNEKNAFAVFPNGILAHHSCLLDAAERDTAPPVGSTSVANPFSTANSQTKPGWFSPAWRTSGVWGAGETAFKIPFYIIPNSLRALFSPCCGKPAKKPKVAVRTTVMNVTQNETFGFLPQDSDPYYSGIDYGARGQAPQISGQRYEYVDVDVDDNNGSTGQYATPDPLQGTYGTLPGEEEPRYDMPISGDTDSRRVPGEEEYLEIDENSDNDENFMKPNGLYALATPGDQDPVQTDQLYDNPPPRQASNEPEMLTNPYYGTGYEENV